MRISTSSFYDRAVSTMQDLQSQTFRTQQQLSSGRRLLSASDDPIAAAQAVDANRMLAESQRDSEASARAGSTLALEESLLANAGQAVQDLHTLVVKAGDPILSASDRVALAQEVRAGYAQLLGVANSRGEDGQFVFAGFRGQVQPFGEISPGDVRYLGDQGQRLVQSAGGRVLAVSDAGDSVFARVQDGNGVFATRAGAGNSGSGVIDAGVVLDASKWAAGAADFSLRFFQTATVSKDGGNTGSAQVRAAVSDAAAWQAGSGRYTVTYTSDTDDVRISDGATSQDFASVQGSPPTVNFGGVDFVIAGAGKTGDSYVVTLDAAAPVTYDLVAHDAATDTYVSSLSGDAGPAAGSPPQWTAAARAYVPGSGIVFSAQGTEPPFSEGVVVTLTGTPAAGDTFAVRASANVDVFAIANDLADALESGLSGAALTNRLNVAMLGLSNALDNVLEVRSSVGSRMKDLEQLQGLAEGLVVQHQQSVAQLQDLDYAKAASDLARQQLALQAAQQSFSRVTETSLFDFLK